MPRKSSSFLYPFFISFIVGVIAGLSALYFGYYRPKLVHYETLIAQATENAPTSKVTSEGITSAGKSSVISATTPVSTQSANMETDDSQAGLPTTKEKESLSSSGTRVDNRSANDSHRKKPDDRSEKNTTGLTIKGGDEETYHRGPAYPKTESTETDAMSDESKDIPSIDDPEMENNPLIKALKMAQERQSDASDQPVNPESKQNPFEFILNQDK